MKKKKIKKIINADIQPQNSQPKERIAPLLPYMWKKGQSGNPKGRPKGKTMKEYAKEMLACQTEEERQEFLHGLPKEIIWKMAEGNPKQDTETELKGNLIIQISEDIANKNGIDAQPENNS